MGATLATQALLHRDVPHRSMRVLIHMALVAYDKPHGDVEAATYWGGWDGLAQVLGYPDANHQTGQRVVAYVLADLQARGLCKPCGPTGGGRGRQVYRLTL